MTHRFASRIRPIVQAELDAAAREEARGDFATAFGHLERVHVLGQAAKREHMRVHWAMWHFARRRHDPHEALGQLWRTVAAALALGWVCCSSSRASSPARTIGDASDDRTCPCVEGPGNDGIAKSSTRVKMASQTLLCVRRGRAGRESDGGMRGRSITAHHPPLMGVGVTGRASFMNRLLQCNGTHEYFCGIEGSEWSHPSGLGGCQL
ncbi:MAG: DUF3703 domain-containing protein [Nitrososphaerota archaeon]|nr:DUF3703 domain-containing protein [Nitrososphaerota archaeon]